MSTRDGPRDGVTLTCDRCRKTGRLPSYRAHAKTSGFREVEVTAQAHHSGDFEEAIRRDLCGACMRELRAFFRVRKGPLSSP